MIEMIGKHQEKRRRHRFGFYKILLLVLVAMVAAIGAGTVYFWRYIEAYESSLPEHVIQSMEENIDYDFWERSLEGAIAPRLTEFERDGLLSSAPYLSEIRDVRFAIRHKSGESTTDSQAYVFRAGSRDIGTVRLLPSGDAGYGFTLWEAGDIELLDSFVEGLSRSISITASQNAQVEVNGVPVSQEYRKDCDVEYAAAYRIDGIFGEPEVSVFEFDGTRSTPYYAENGEYLYPVIIPFAREYSFIVPEGAVVLVDGEAVSREYITDGGIVPDIFIGFIEPESVPLKLQRYEFELEGLYLEPTVTVTDAQGAELLRTVSEDGEISYTEEFSLEYEELYAEGVEAFVRAFVRFGANIGNNATGNFANLSGYMLRNSDLYRRTQASLEGMIWIHNATVEFNSLEIDCFRPYGDEYFSCEVRYNVTNRTNYEAREVEGNYEVLFVLSGGKWLAAKMDNL